VRKLIAVIGDSANAGSVGVHRRKGFSQVGVHQALRLEVRPLARHRADGKVTGRSRRAPRRPKKKAE
jgi:L-amino acid N-acyltransferase YncA